MSLRLPAGVTGLLGPNGSGKSTLIKALLGLLKPQSGQGRVLDFQWPRDVRQIRDSIGYLPEDDCYIAGLQGIESVTLMAQLSGISGREGLRRSHEMMDFCGFGEERYREVESYSTGMRQKLKFAQAMVHDPPLLILDEPTTGLDPDQRFAMLRRIGNLAKHHGKSIILSTHILPDVRTVCDQVVILVGGTVRVVDSLENLSQPASPTMSVAAHGDPTAFVNRIREKGMSVSLSGSAASESTDNASTVTALSTTIEVEGIQPQDVRQLWELAAETGTAIRRLEPAVNSLEQIFMDVASGKRTESVPGEAKIAADRLQAFTDDQSPFTEAGDRSCR